MKKTASLIFVILLLVGCGVQQSAPVSRTTVRFDLSLPGHSGVEKARFAPSATPSGIASVSVTVTGPDFGEITESAEVVGGTAVLTISVPDGEDRDFTIEARNRSGLVVYRGEENDRSLDGGTITLDVEIFFDPGVLSSGEGAISISAPGDDDPLDPIAVGETKPLQAIGILIDGSEVDITTSVTWVPTSVTVNGVGLAFGESVGPAEISATLTLSETNAVLTSNLLTFTVTPLPDSRKIVDVAAGGEHTCAAFADGSAKCWGKNFSGELGNGESGNDALVESNPVAVRNITNVVEVAAGGFHSCARHADGAVSCWGLNSFGQLGNDSTTSSATPVSVSDITNATHIAAGLNHSCAVLATGGIKCWGYNFSGQLGNSSTTNSLIPVSVVGISNAVDISALYEHTCALLGNGVKCWGENGSGQLGDGGTDDSSSPVEILGSSGALSVSPGVTHTCFVDAGGLVNCVGGNNFFKQLVTSTVFAAVNNALSVASGRLHACALADDGADDDADDVTVKCAGFNLNGQLGNGSNLPLAIASSVSDLSGVVNITAGPDHTCALLDNDTVQCWGLNTFGQLGNGTTTDSNIPVSLDFSP